jgi:hypothetical protein
VLAQSIDAVSERKELIKINPLAALAIFPLGIQHSLEVSCLLLWLGTGNYIQPIFHQLKKSDGKVRFVAGWLFRAFNVSPISTSPAKSRREERKPPVLKTEL